MISGQRSGLAVAPACSGEVLALGEGQRQRGGHGARAEIPFIAGIGRHQTSGPVNHRHTSLIAVDGGGRDRPVGLGRIAGPVLGPAVDQ
jgi:hypothetical protein